MAQVAMYYRYGTSSHVLQVWHKWPYITGMAQVAMYYRYGTSSHVLQVWHNWPCITGVAQVAIYYRHGTSMYISIFKKCSVTIGGTFLQHIAVSVFSFKKNSRKDPLSN